MEDVKVKPNKSSDSDQITADRKVVAGIEATATKTTVERNTGASESNYQDDSASYNHQCYICDKIFSANSNLNRHLRKIHKENVQSPYNNVKCALCDSVYSSSSIYNSHLETDHQVKIDVVQLTFADKETFENWKHEIENETTSQFIKSRGEKRTKNVNKTYYSCNRSGYYISKARTRKALKKQGSRKINGRCPASMNVTVNPDSSYSVRFVKTHVGHSFELKHLDLSDKDRDLIVQKLTSGVTKRDIIKQIRSAAVEQQSQQPNSNASMSPASSISGAAANIQPVIISGRSCVAGGEQIEVITTTSEIIIGPNSTSSSATSTPIPTATTPQNSSILSTSHGQPPISRLHLATTKDIHNILNSKHLDSKKIRHNYDLNNVEAWINEMREFNETCSVLFYKNQTELVARFPKLREDDFMLVIMKTGQVQIFKDYGGKCVILDSTHSVHCEYLHVAYISVVDEERRGLPVAFLFSTRTDVDVLEAFFAIIKDKVGLISTRMFIADELHDFYQAWWKVMTMPIHNLLSPWTVFEAWSKKFETIRNRERLRKIKKQLRSLLTETEPDKFSRSLKQIISDNKSEADCGEFISFFEEHYCKSPDVWSNCLRKNYGVSNFQLWGLHEKFKSVYKEGKNSKKLCKYVASLMNLFEEYQLEKLIRLEDASRQKATLNRHKKSLESGSLVYEVAVEPVYWLCPSESSNEVYYEVKHDENWKKSANQKNCCNSKCPTCNTCRHEYKCTCLDYLVNLNMCKHIHRICMMCK